MSWLDNKKDKRFYIIYVSGLLITFFFAIVKIFLIYTKNISLLKDLNSENTNIVILSISLIVIFILYIWAKIKTKTNNSNAFFYKEYIQLEGYIQTLIGFFIAILSIVPIDVENKNNYFSIGLIAYPISLSLITSILGWFFGSDIAPPIKENNIIDDLNDNVSRLKQNMNSLSDVISDSKQRYENTTELFADNLNNVFSIQNELINEYEKSLHSLIYSKEQYRDQINNSLLEFKTDFINFNSEIKQSISILNKDIYEIQRKNQENQLNSLNDFYANLNLKIKNETDKINISYHTFETYLKSIENDFFNTSKIISQFIQKIDNYNNSVISNTNKTNITLESIDKEFNNIKNEIKNIKKTILDDLYSNHKLRDDIRTINESIKNLKPSKYISITIGLPKWLKKNK